MSRTFRITEEDLCTLESELPEILEREGELLNDVFQRKRWEMVKGILSNVRWEYGPPLEVRRLPASNEEQ